MTTIEELQDENKKLREQLVNQVDKTIAGLREKDKLLDDLMEKTRQLIDSLGDKRIMMEALSKIILDDTSPTLSAIAEKALGEVTERVKERHKDKKKE